MTGAVERVTLTHLQIPLKEVFRISGGEVAVKDAIVVAVETACAVGLGESSAMAAGFGYSDDTPEGCWDDLCTRIAPSLLGHSFADTDEIAALAETWHASRFAAAGAETACWDLLAQSRHETIAEMLGTAHSYVNMRVESGLAVGLYGTVVALLKAIETHLAEGYRRRSRSRPGATSSSFAPCGSTSATSSR
jgi:O-succinylbenzoate synthase